MPCPRVLVAGADDELDACPVETPGAGRYPEDVLDEQPGAALARGEPQGRHPPGDNHAAGKTA